MPRQRPHVKPGPFCSPEALIPLMKAGDLQALDRLTRCYSERLLAVGRKRCGDDQRAQDAVQDALLAAGENLTSFRGEGSVEGWLVRMVANACHRMRRGRKNDPKWHAELNLELPDLGTNPEDHALRGQLAMAIGDALVALDPIDRTLILLSGAEGWRGPEMAEELGMTPAAVRTRLSRLRRKLRGTLLPVWKEVSD